MCDPLIEQIHFIHAPLHRFKNLGHVFLETNKDQSGIR